MMYLPSIFGDNLMDDFFDDFDRSFFEPARPAIRTERTDLMKTDIRETETGYELDVELPGYKKEDLNLELTNGYLTISAAPTRLARCPSSAARNLAGYFWSIRE